MSSLCLHRGAKVIDMEQLRGVITPEATETWTPIAHGQFVDSVRNALVSNGATIASEEHALYRDGDRYFGLLNLANGEDGGNTVIGLGTRMTRPFQPGYQWAIASSFATTSASAVT